MTSKCALWRQQVRHEFKNTYWRQKVVMMWKNMSWCEKVYHEVKSASWRQKVRQTMLCVKQCYVTFKSLRTDTHTYTHRQTYSLNAIVSQPIRGSTNKTSTDLLMQAADKKHFCKCSTVFRYALTFQTQSFYINVINIYNSGYNLVKNAFNIYAYWHKISTRVTKIWLKRSERETYITMYENN